MDTMGAPSLTRMGQGPLPTATERPGKVMEEVVRPRARTHTPGLAKVSAWVRGEDSPSSEGPSTTMNTEGLAATVMSNPNREPSTRKVKVVTVTFGNR